MLTAATVVLFAYTAVAAVIEETTVSMKLALTNPPALGISLISASSVVLSVVGVVSSAVGSVGSVTLGVVQVAL
jgi:hypothetical protein